MIALNKILSIVNLSLLGLIQLIFIQEGNRDISFLPVFILFLFGMSILPIIYLLLSRKAKERELVNWAFVVANGLILVGNLSMVNEWIQQM